MNDNFDSKKEWGRKSLEMCLRNIWMVPKEKPLQIIDGLLSST